MGRREGAYLPESPRERRYLLSPPGKSFLFSGEGSHTSRG